MRLMLCAFVVVVVAACGDSVTEPETPSLAGRWSGSSGNVTMTLTLTDDGETVDGNGTIKSVLNSIALSVKSGVYTFPSFSIVLEASGYNDMNFSGRIQNNGTELLGDLNGSGFNDLTIVLRKQ